MTRYIVFDKKGVIHESSDCEAARKEFEETTEFEGDLVFAQEIERRR